MPEPSIMFSPPMAQAVRDDRKTQTRRILLHPDEVPAGVKIRRVDVVKSGMDPERELWGALFIDRGPEVFVPIRYRPQQQAWVREQCWLYGQWHPDGTTAKTKRAAWRFEAIGQDVRYDKPAARELATRGGAPGFVYRPSMFMPRWASRTSIDVRNVQVQRLQAITEADARAEGTKPRGDGTAAHRAAFRLLWCEIHDHASWDANPWVSVISFARVR